MSYPVSINLLPEHAGFLSLQEAAESTAISTHTATNLELYANGCDFIDQHGKNLRNCTDVCQDPAAVWRSMYTLHNCLVYPIISDFLSSDHLTLQGQSDALSMGYLPAFELQRIMDPIDLCVESFCHDVGKAGECRANYGTNLTSVNGADVDTFFSAEFLDSACGASTVSPNVDVGGIGVYIGYLMQLSIILYIYLLSRLLSSWLHTLASLMSITSRADALQSRFNASNHLPALLAGQIEYQKAQCFFALTLHGAAIKALLGDGYTFEARSLQELHLTINLIRDVASTGIVCVTFGLYMLHRAGKRAWYTTALSLVAVGVAGLAWGLTWLPLENLKRLEPAKRSLAACGGLSPVTFCLDNDVRLSKWLEAGSIAMCIIILATLLHGYHETPERGTRSDEKRTVSTASSSTNTLVRYVGSMLDPYSSPHLTEVILFILTLAHLIHLCTKNEMLYVEESAKWDFAQLIAVTIWAPAIVEYLYAAVRGVEKMQKHRQVTTSEQEEGGVEDGERD
ncbi:unnamed protein product [Zymoseptoria tritici ST99CH_3D7]|uniref:Uncharacterized protein n=1 Tax=Zymoseptoria tritici (strain ST99CH_3D7) TaxID=1276538 RepID=A0A1X7RPE5_ZYMT9|nr:unnamed protein product [Zymoseptoria tritici ST99CH_3D7]